MRPTQTNTSNSVKLIFFVAILVLSGACGERGQETPNQHTENVNCEPWTGPANPDGWWNETARRIEDAALIPDDGFLKWSAPDEAAMFICGLSQLAGVPATQLVIEFKAEGSESASGELLSTCVVDQEHQVTGAGELNFCGTIGGGSFTRTKYDDYEGCIGACSGSANTKETCSLESASPGLRKSEKHVTEYDLNLTAGKTWDLFGEKKFGIATLTGSGELTGTVAGIYTATTESGQSCESPYTYQTPKGSASGGIAFTLEGAIEFGGSALGGAFSVAGKASANATIGTTFHWNEQCGIYTITEVSASASGSIKAATGANGVTVGTTIASLNCGVGYTYNACTMQGNPVPLECQWEWIESKPFEPTCESLGWNCGLHEVNIDDCPTVLYCGSVELPAYCEGGVIKNPGQQPCGDCSCWESNCNVEAEAVSGGIEENYWEYYCECMEDVACTGMSEYQDNCVGSEYPSTSTYSN